MLTTKEGKKHIGMLTDIGFGHDWANASELVARTTRIDIRKGKVGAGGHNLAHIQIRPSRYLGRANLALEGRQLAKLLMKVADSHERVDILHGHFFDRSEGLSRAADRLQVPFVLTEHKTAVTGVGTTSSRFGQSELKRARRMYEHSSAVIAVSTYLKSVIDEFADCSCFVVGNPIDIDLFHPGPEVPFSRHERPIKLICVGRLVPSKGLDFLLHGFKKITEVLDAELSIIGQGREHDRLRNLTMELGLNDQVTFHGRLARPSIAELARGSDLGVSTSVIETFGLSAAEFSSTGLPVVAPDRPPFDEVLPPSGRILYEEGSLESFKDAVEQACNTSWDPVAIRTHIAERFALPIIAEKLHRIYQEL